MIKFQKEILDSGLTVIIHQDPSAGMVAVNTLYKVGARDEKPDKTGFAHLFEHLMFSGSINVPEFDTPLQRAGGQNNAFTNNDFTNYYITIPEQNLETALWLESDRMLGLAFSEQGLEVQRKVVVEEFRQRYLNQPYGDLWLELRPMAYTVHPYRWATIGKSIDHIEQATMDDVKSFYRDFYTPSNAVLVLAGNLNVSETMKRVQKWYGDIPTGEPRPGKYPEEPLGREGEIKKLYREVPQNAIHMAWLMTDRRHELYHAYDLLSDILSGGKSARFYRHLVKKQGLFTRLSAYITGSVDSGLFVISGMIAEGGNHDQARKAIFKECRDLLESGIPDKELEKVKNKVIAQKAFEESDTLNKAMNLAYHEYLGDASEVNLEKEKYESVTKENILEILNDLIHNRGVFELQYHKIHE